MKLVIGITGKLGSGKDYIAENIIIPVLNNFYGKSNTCLKLCFADQLKINMMVKNNINFSDVYENKTSEVRQLLQREGTLVARNYDKNIWIDYLDNWSQVYYQRGIRNFIISDVRFLNELDYVKAEHNNIMIKVVSPKRNIKRLLEESKNDYDIFTKIKNHRSECELDNVDDRVYDLIINNDIDDDLNIQKIQSLFLKLLNNINYNQF